MSLDHNNFYARWRRECGVVPALHDGAEPPPERLLQAIWQQQRFRRERLNSLDGRSVAILHPGFLSVEGGPDFRGAVVQFGSEPPVNGDIEVDLRAGGWKAHGHDRNPKFRSVILHVVWSPPGRQQEGPPILPVAGALDAPLAELAEWLGGEVAPALPEAYRGRCSAPLRELSEPALQALLEQAALVRLHGKAAHCAARARESGWEQALWEGLFRALGYKHNAWPMQRLAELRSRWQNGAGHIDDLQARLLGVANLLPAQVTRAQTDTDGYVRGLWDHWWRERDAFEDCVLPRSLWRLHGIRPGNHPQRRLALAAHWLVGGKLMAKLERWGVGDEPKSVPHSAQGRMAALAATLQPAHDDFWSTHLTLRSARSPKPRLLLGDARVTDLAVNVILPWLLARAAEGRNENLQASLEACYLDWPAGEDNSVLKLARQRLLGGAGLKSFRTAAAQQGLLQIIRDFCDHCDSTCDQCRFPELVRSHGLRVQESPGMTTLPGRS